MDIEWITDGSMAILVSKKNFVLVSSLQILEDLCLKISRNMVDYSKWDHIEVFAFKYVHGWFQVENFLVF